MRLLFLCKRYYTNKDLIEDRFGRLYHLPVGLCRRGDLINVIALDYRNPSVVEVRSDGVAFQTLPATPGKILSVPSAVMRRVKAFAPDVILASGDSHIGFLGLLVAGRIGSKFVFDVYDYYPAFRGNRIPGFKAMFRKAVSNADLVLCASLPLFERLASLNTKRLLIENGVDRNLFKPEDMRLARESLGIPEDSVVIGYFGSINADRGPLLIEACRELRREFPNLCLLMAGKARQVDLEASWIRYLGELPQALLPKLIAACDVVTLPYANDPFNSMTGACKIAEYLACEKPVVATRVAGHEAMFRDAPASLCDPNPLGMLTALKQQAGLRQIAKFPESLEWKFIAGMLWEHLRGLPRGKNAR